jgi:hypothetical protein
VLLGGVFRYANFAVLHVDPVHAWIA